MVNNSVTADSFHARFNTNRLLNTKIEAEHKPMADLHSIKLTSAQDMLFI